MHVVEIVSSVSSLKPVLEFGIRKAHASLWVDSPSCLFRVFLSLDFFRWWTWGLFPGTVDVAEVVAAHWRHSESVTTLHRETVRGTPTARREQRKDAQKEPISSCLPRSTRKEDAFTSFVTHLLLQGARSKGLIPPKNQLGNDKRWPNLFFKYPIRSDVPRKWEVRNGF